MLSMAQELVGKCHFCDMCDGHGCLGELPGMGGVYDNGNFIANREGWEAHALRDEGTSIPLPAIRLAPITGAVQNVGYREERAFYHDLIEAAVRADIRLSIGDGCPDEKILFGIEALSRAGKKGAVFIKPYPDERIHERIEWARPVSEIVGIDIDSYAIVTMRNLVNLEEKNAASLIALKKKAGVPFAIKGVFKKEDIELVREVKPDIVVISNHGGRVETRKGHTVGFLAEYGKELSSHAGEIWIDGGVRTRKDLETAARYGVKEVMIGRPFISALLRHGLEGICLRMNESFRRSIPS